MRYGLASNRASHERSQLRLDPQCGSFGGGATYKHCDPGLLCIAGCPGGTRCRRRTCRAGHRRSTAHMVERAQTVGIRSRRRLAHREWRCALVWSFASVSHGSGCRESLSAAETLECDSVRSCGNQFRSRRCVRLHLAHFCRLDCHRSGPRMKTPVFRNVFRHLSLVIGLIKNLC
jgi:hypothetical protein